MHPNVHRIDMDTEIVYSYALCLHNIHIQYEWIGEERVYTVYSYSRYKLHYILEWSSHYSYYSMNKTVFAPKIYNLMRELQWLSIDQDSIWTQDWIWSWYRHESVPESSPVYNQNMIRVTSNDLTHVNGHDMKQYPLQSHVQCPLKCW